MSPQRALTALALGLTCVLAAGCSSEVHLGGIVSETGAAAIYGEKVKKGMDLALEQTDAAGGYNGKTVKIDYRDDQTRPEVGLEVARELIDDVGVRVIIGAVTSSVTLKIAPLCESKKVILMSPTASAPKITEAGDYIYRVYPSDILEGTSIADFARDLGLERVAVFAVNNEFGAGLEQVFVEKYESKFRKVVKTFEFEEGAGDAFDPMVEEVKQLQPDGIYIIAYVGDLAELLKRLRAAGIESVIMGNSSVTQDVVRLAGAAAENLLFPMPAFDVDSDDEATKAFVEAYRKKYGEDPDRFSAHGYDAVNVVVQAAREGGSFHPDDLKIGLQNIDNYRGASGRITFDANGDVVQYPRMFIIRDGKPIPYEKFVEGGGSLPLPGRG